MKLLEEQIKILSSNIIVSCSNRKGLRKATGKLLESYFFKLTSLASPDLTIEVGAHEARFSRYVSNNLKKSRCIAFEANPHVFDKYKNILLPMNIEYLNTAISQKSGKISFSIPLTLNDKSLKKDNAISSIHKRNHDGFTYKTVNVDSKQLDSFTFQNHQHIILWIDVEGAQYDVLASAGKLWSNIDAVYIEVEKKRVWENQILDYEIREYLISLGFVEIMRDNLAIYQYNSVYLKKNLIKNIEVQELIRDYCSELIKLLD